MQFNKLFVLAIVAFLGCNSSGNNAKQEELHLSPVAVEKPVPQDALIFDKSAGIVYYDNRPFTGVAITRYANGLLASSMEFVEGKRQGKYKKFFADGELSYEANYANGKLHGTSKTWWKNGNLRTMSNFVNGVADGVQLQYYKSGALFKKINLVMGKEEGLQQSWRENGKLYNNYEARNGRIFGLKRSKLCFKLDDEKVQN